VKRLASSWPAGGPKRLWNRRLGEVIRIGDHADVLGLATVSPKGLQVLARAPVLSHLAWTTPTLAGTTLYVGDRKTLGAFAFGAF
jgi:hypothetical protein